MSELYMTEDERKEIVMSVDMPEKAMCILNDSGKLIQVPDNFAGVYYYSEGRVEALIEEKQAIKQRLIAAFHAHSDTYFEDIRYEDAVKIIEEVFSESK